MGGNGGDNAHNNAFGGGKNPGMGNSGSGSNSGSSGNSGKSGSWNYNPGKGPAATVGPDGQVHINITGGLEPGKQTPNGNGGGKGGNGNGSTGNEATITPDPEKPGSYILSPPGRFLLTKTIDDNSSNGTGSFVLHTITGATITVTVPDGDINRSYSQYSNWRGPEFNYKVVRNFISGFMAFRAKEKANDEKGALLKASELISDMGEKIGSHLGDKYKAVAKEIAEDIKNFQGKSIRNYNQAMASLNKILANPAMKVYQADKDALINAWRSLNAGDMANKLGNLSRAFKTADVAMKVEKIREKSITGYETGDWGPLMLEVESWVLSGVAVGVAMSILADLAPALAAFINLPVTAITILGIIAIAVIASFIDDKFADKVNNELIKPVH